MSAMVIYLNRKTRILNFNNALVENDINLKKLVPTLMQLLLKFLRLQIFFLIFKLRILKQFNSY